MCYQAGRTCLPKRESKNSGGFPQKPMQSQFGVVGADFSTSEVDTQIAVWVSTRK